MPGNNKWLVLGGTLSAAAAILHLAVIAGGPAWYRFFGAGEAMAQAAERGSFIPALITLAIAAILMVWALYAFSGARIIRRLPLLRTALVVISAVYLIRAFVLVPALVLRPDLVDTFALVSSLVVLAYGLAYAIGTWAGWAALKVEARSGKA
ncbi:MAG TPA: hypothetical protein VEZ70_09920 [Allosphingosinicella sp.]|nr:hypothetical protein [Allosphingosinicella sp.]